MRMWVFVNRSVLIVSFFFISIISFAQTLPVSGKVTTASGEPLSGVTVQVKNGGAGTATIADGTFHLTVPSANSVLVFTYVGFAQKEVPVNNQRQLNVSLSAQNTTMDEVVVVGYGSRKKGEVTGAITSISGENLRSVPTTNLTQALQGRLAGVTVTPSGFRPGTGSAIRVRGNRSLSASNEPLYVVDGFPVSYTIEYESCRH